MSQNRTAVCQTCAVVYYPAETSSPRRYCSQECYNWGERPYNKGEISKTEQKRIELTDYAEKALKPVWHFPGPGVLVNDFERLDSESEILVQYRTAQRAAAKIFGKGAESKNG